MGILQQAGAHFGVNNRLKAETSYTLSFMKRNLLFILLLSVAGLLPVTAQNELPVDPAVRKGTLPNGLTYYIRHNAYPEGRANFYIAQRVGSIQEEDNQRGLAHFLEHMCFNGTEHFPGNGVIRFCERIGVQFGSNLNAYTSIDQTVYNIDNVPTDRTSVLDSCLLVLRDWADGLQLDPKEIDKERGVIREEWRMRSSASLRMLERQLPALYPDSKYGHRMPIGLMSVVENFKPETLRAYYEKWYRPDLQGIVVVGDFDADSMENAVKRLFGDIRMPANAAPYVTYPVPDNTQAIVVTDKDKEQQVTSLSIQFKTDPLPRDMNNTVQAFLAAILQNMSGMIVNDRLSELIVKHPDAPFSSVEFGYDDYQLSKNKKAFALHVVPKSGQDTAALKMTFREIQRILQHGVTAGEFERTRTSLLSYYNSMYENRNKQKNGFYTQACVSNFLDNTPLMSIEAEYELVKQLTAELRPEDLTALLRHVITPSDTNLVITGFYPDKEGVTPLSHEALLQAVHEVRTEQLAPYTDQTRNEPLIATLPTKGHVVKTEQAPHGYTCWTLSNGAKVYWRKTDFSDNEILFTATGKGGRSLLPEADLPNARLMANIINQSGRGAFNSIELNKYLSDKQVSLSVSMGELTQGLSGTSTKKDLRTLMELLYLTLTDTREEPEVYTRTVNQLRTYFENADKNPVKVLQDSTSVTLYGRNPHTAGFGKEDLEKTDYAGILRIFKERFANSAGFNYLFTGNIEEDSLRQWAEQYIGALPAARGKEQIRDNHAYPQPGNRTNRFYRTMETPQAYLVQFRFLDTDVSLRNAVLADLTGQILTMSYTDSIREARGIAYSVDAGGSLERSTKSFALLQTICPVKPEKSDSALLLIDQAIERIAREGVNTHYLEHAKKHTLKVTDELQTKNSYWHGIINSIVNWNFDQATNRREAVQAITADEVRRFAGKMLKKGSTANIIMLPAPAAQ